MSDRRELHDKFMAALRVVEFLTCCLILGLAGYWALTALGNFIMHVGEINKESEIHSACLDKGQIVFFGDESLTYHCVRVTK